jgi:hypothetical protein
MKIIKIAFVVFSNLVLLSSVFAQSVDTINCQLKFIARLPKSVEEISGMVFTKKGFWVHNDSDNGPFIMRLNEKGIIQSVKKITNAANYDWEDIASDQRGNLYIGDIGNNFNNRRTLQVYKIADPSKSSEINSESEKIEFSYPDQHSFPPKEAQLIFDAEAMLYFNDSLFIFNKNRSSPFDGFVRMYKIPAKPGKYDAQLVDSVYLGGKSSINNWITGADISRDGKRVALLSSDKIWVFGDFKGSAFFKGSIKLIRLNHFSQKEAICFDDENNLFVADELFERILGGSLYQITCEK